MDRRGLLSAGGITAAGLIAGCATAAGVDANGATRMVFRVPQPMLPIAGSTELFPVRRIYCIGRNYAAHAREMGSDPNREPPFFFQKPSDAVQFVAPGIISMTILFSSVFSGMGLLWDRQFGFLKETLVAPVPRLHVMLGKTFKGLTDATLAWQTQEFLKRETHRDEWTVHLRPELVVEIAFNDLQESSQYPGGLALRFARVKGYRPDKRPEEADTIDTVRRIYQESIA